MKWIEIKSTLVNISRARAVYVTKLGEHYGHLEGKWAICIEHEPQVYERFTFDSETLAREKFREIKNCVLGG